MILEPGDLPDAAPDVKSSATSNWLGKVFFSYPFPCACAQGFFYMHTAAERKMSAAATR